MLLQQKQDGDAVASIPPPPKVFIAAQLVSLPVFILVCTFFFYMVVHKPALLFSWEIPLLPWWWWWPSNCELNYKNNEWCCENGGLPSGLSLQALKMTAWRRFPSFLDISVQILPWPQNALSFKCTGHQENTADEPEHKNLLPRHGFDHCAASTTKLSWGFSGCNKVFLFGNVLNGHVTWFFCSWGQQWLKCFY